MVRLECLSYCKIHLRTEILVIFQKNHMTTQNKAYGYPFNCPTNLSLSRTYFTSGSLAIFSRMYFQSAGSLLNCLLVLVDNNRSVDVAQCFQFLGCDCFWPKNNQGLGFWSSYELPNISIFEKNTNSIYFLSLRKVREYAERNLSLTKQKASSVLMKNRCYFFTHK